MFRLKKKLFCIVLLILSFHLISINFANAIEAKEVNLINKKYAAIVLGEITKSKIRKIHNLYLTEYKLKVTDWIHTTPSVEMFKKKYLSIKVLGANLKNQGLVIKTQYTPDYVPIKKQAIFLLEKSKSKKKNSFTLTKGGIILQKKKELM